MCKEQPHALLEQGEIRMLDRLDTLIAFATIMLGISLLITILNQMVGALFAYRGRQLKNGIIDLIGTLDPDLAPQAATIANDVLTHQLVSDSIFARVQWGLKRWKLATSIRPEELTKVLRALSSGTAAKAYGPKIMALLDQVDPALERDAKLLADTVNSAVSTAAGAGVATADQILKQLSDKANKAVGRVEAAFNSTMDRVRQRFTMQIRIWTVFFSVVLAFAYHLDAAKIYSLLSTDPALRASLGSVSKTLLDKYPSIEKCEPSQTQTTTAATAGAKQSEAQQSGAQQPGGTSSTTTSTTEKDNVPCDAQKLAATYKEVRDQLSNPKLALFEVPHGKEWWSFGGSGGIFRILATAALLSLGAPFWYNALKSLVNLRSQVAEQQSKEAKA